MTDTSNWEMFASGNAPLFFFCSATVSEIQQHQMFWRHEKNQSHSAISQVTQWNLNACRTSVFCGLSLCSSKVWMISNVVSAGLTRHMHASSARPPLHSLHPLSVPKLFIHLHFAATGWRQNHNKRHNQPGYALFSRAVAALRNIC